ncbi:MAG TPA: hypothetical protein PLQ36_00065 [Candidatus Gracilibacteria bacterium]|nr:hypothetical protein [Candidatus Gracilibacteria bacterium]
MSEIKKISILDEENIRREQIRKLLAHFQMSEAAIANYFYVENRFVKFFNGLTNPNFAGLAKVHLEIQQAFSNIINEDIDLEDLEPSYLLRTIALFLDDVRRIELQFEPLKIADIQADTKERILRVGKTENPIKECRDLGISNAEILDVMPNLLNNPIIVGDLNGNEVSIDYGDNSLSVNGKNILPKQIFNLLETDEKILNQANNSLLELKNKILSGDKVAVITDREADKNLQNPESKLPVPYIHKLDFSWLINFLDSYKKVSVKIKADIKKLVQEDAPKLWHKLENISAELKKQIAKILKQN